MNALRHFRQHQKDPQSHRNSYPFAHHPPNQGVLCSKQIDCERNQQLCSKLWGRNVPNTIFFVIPSIFLQLSPSSDSVSPVSFSVPHFHHQISDTQCLCFSHPRPPWPNHEFSLQAQGTFVRLVSLCWGPSITNLSFS